jgi:hypothetical protein
MPRKRRIAVCHPNMRHQGKGLCTRCYCREFYRRKYKSNGTRVYTHMDLTGLMFGNWLVKEIADTRDSSGNILWKCECQCLKNPVKLLSTSTLRNSKKLNQSCGCKSKVRLRPHEARYNRLKFDNKWNRKARTVEFTYEEFLEFVKIKKCHYCWSQIDWGKEYNINGNSRYNLDRKDNNLDYTTTNCVVCCERCNKGKRDFFTYDEWYGMTAYFRKER